VVASSERMAGLIALDDALTDLAKLHPRQSEVVELEPTMERVAEAITRDDQRFGIHPHLRKERGARSRRQNP